MMLSDEIRNVVAGLHAQILKDELTIETATLARDILRDVADRVELIEGLIVPEHLTMPETPRPDGNVVRFDPWRKRLAALSRPAPQTPSTPA